MDIKTYKKCYNMYCKPTINKADVKPCNNASEEPNTLKKIACAKTNGKTEAVILPSVNVKSYINTEKPTSLKHNIKHNKVKHHKTKHHKTKHHKTKHHKVKHHKTKHNKMKHHKTKKSASGSSSSPYESSSRSSYESSVSETKSLNTVSANKEKKHTRKCKSETTSNAKLRSKLKQNDGNRGNDNEIVLNYLESVIDNKINNYIVSMKETFAKGFINALG
jgi:hypothetical protein